MFRLHETTRRRVCRLAFVACCALPTLGTGVWIAHWHRPWRVADAEMRLSSALQSDVRLVDWEEPRPSTTLTRGVKIFADGSPDPLFEATDVRTSRVGGSRAVFISRAVIDARRLNMGIAQATRWITQRGVEPVHTTVDEIVFLDRANGLSCAFQHVAVHAKSVGGNAWKLDLRAGNGGDDKSELRISWDLAASKVETVCRATIDASQISLPAWLLSSAGPLYGCVGDTASFSGHLQYETLGGEVVGMARGQISDIALGAMLPRSSPCRVDGAAELKLAEFRWRDVQIEQMTGSMTASDVTVNPALLEGATKSLWFGQLAIGPASPQTDALGIVAVDAVALRFEFNRQGLIIAGDFPTELNLPPGCVAVSGGRPLLMQPQYLLPAGLWVQFVTGPATASMPATQEAVGVAARLPLPESTVAK